MANLWATVARNAHQRAAEQFPELVPQYNTDFAGRNIVLFGSFSSENWTRIRRARATFESLGFFALAPQGKDFVQTVDNFGVLDADVLKVEQMEQTIGRPLAQHEIAAYLEIFFQMAMDIADIRYLVADRHEGITDGGYMGLTASLELGRVVHKPVIVSEAISPTLDERDGYDDPIFAGYIEGLYVATPEEVVAVLDGGGRFAARYGRTFIEELQS